MTSLLRSLFKFFAGPAGCERRRAVVEECEPRILYSADLNPALWGDAGSPAEVRLVTPQAAAPAQTQEQTQEQRRSREIVFVDAAVPDAQALIDAMLAARGPNADIEVVHIDADADGLQQIAAVLAGERDLSAIHIVSHGESGRLQLGNGTVDAQTLNARAEGFDAWRAALTADADILLYGCNVAAGAQGQAFVRALAQTTGADVAASTDATGSAERGGDWVLEVETGHIEASLSAIGRQLEQNWSGLLTLTPQGSETRVNSAITGAQTTTTYGGGNVAMDSSGNYVVAWNDANTSSGDIYFQRYNASGVAQGANTLVNTYTANPQNQARVAMDAAGNFVVVWSSSNQDGSGTGIYAQRYNAGGVAQGGEFRVNTATANNQEMPTVAMSTTGAFVVAWMDDTADGSGSGVYAQRYDAGGVAQGSEFRVNSTTAGYQGYASAAMDASGNSVFVWESDQTGDYDIYGQRYNASGVAQGAEFQVNTATVSGQWSAAVAMDSAGNFVVAWEANSQDPGINAGIYAQRFNNGGVAQGTEFRVNTTTADAQIVPAVAMNSSGGFIVAWQSNLQDGSGYGVYTQQYNASGVAQGGETQVATTTANDQVAPSVAYAGAKAVVAWAGNGTGDADGVFVQRYGAGAAPVNTVPGAQTANEDTAKVFSSGNGNPISISDADAGGADNQVTISVTNGTLTLAGTAGLTFINGDGTADAAMTIRGSAAAINTALDGLSYSPAADYNGGATLTLATQDSVLLSLDIDTGLLGHYTFESSGTLGSDTSPAAGNNGTVSGASAAVDGTRGNVVSLAGAGYVQATGRFGSPANVTLAAWVNLTSADSNGAEVISLGDNVLLRLDSGGNLVGGYYNGSTWTGTYYAVALAGTGWHHVAYSFNDAGDATALYFDGALVASIGTADSISYTRGADSFIGKHGDGSSLYDFNGRIDDARIYNRVLTAAEIATLAADLSMTDTDSVAITITAVNDAPAISSNGGGATAAIGIAENTTAVTTVTSTDIDGGTAVYSILPGGDGAKFAIDASTGMLSFIAAPDYENPTDAGANNIYDVTVRVSDGAGGIDTQAIAATVTDVSNTLVVTTTADSNDTGLGSSFTIEQLNASKGADNAVSLREAIIAANTAAGTDTISFAIGGTGVHTIDLAGALPTITGTVLLDASTDDSFAANGNRPAIVLNGGGTIQDGLQIYGAASSGSTVRGLVIQNFAQDGIDIGDSGGNTIVGNWIGLNSADTAAAGNAAGINIWNSSNNVIGGSTAADRNVISGNTALGIGINTDNGGSTGNLIRGNYIGTDAAGMAAVGNGAEGVWINAAGNTVGGTVAGQGNVIGGTASWVGLDLTGAASGTLVAGNLIGLNAAGTAALGNAGGGIYISGANNIIGGTTAAARNVISGNGGQGVTLGGAGASGNVLIGNYIGTDITGTADVNGSAHTVGLSGVMVMNGATNNRIGTDADGSNDAAERNIISGNNWYGIEFIGAGTSGNVAQGNYIGTDVTGQFALGNSQGGVSFWLGASGNRLGSGVAGAGNVISSNETGVLVANGVTNNTVQGNLIGLAADGSKALGNSGFGVFFYNGATTSLIGGNLIGSDGDGSNDAGERNVISANYSGVVMNDAEVSGNIVAGNYIGTDATGTLDRGNTTSGVVLALGANGNTIGGSTAATRNVISGNDVRGIEVWGANGNTIRGNYIGLQANGVSALGNGYSGVYLYNGSAGNAIGGTAAADANRIAYNGLPGVALGSDAGAGNAIMGNTIYGNGGGTYLGINLSGGSENSSEVTANDSGDGDSGANNLQNFPVLATAHTDGSSQLVLAGSLNSTANGWYRIEFFANASPDASGHGQGQIFLGFVNVATDASGNATIGTTLSVTVAAGSSISATATRGNAGYTVFTDTSEFAQCAIATVVPTITTTGATLAYAENGAATAVDSGLTVNDADSTNLTGATVTISTNYAVGQDVLAFTNQLGITGSWNAGTGVLTLSGTTTLANYQAALRSITYVNTSDSPSTATRIVGFVVNDGSADSNTGTRSIAVAAVNDAPALSGANNLTTVSEDPSSNAGTLVSTLIAGLASDLDAGASSGIAVTAVDNTNGTWQYSTDGGSAWLSFGSPSTASARLLAADASTLVRFVPNANWSGTVANGITFHAWDQTSGSAGGVGVLALPQTVSDSFSASSYSNNNGTTSWSTSWVENDSATGGASGGEIKVVAGSLSMRSTVPGDSIYRQADLTGASAATLTFDYTNSLGSGDRVDLQISNNGGSSYVTLATFSPSSNTGTGAKSIDIGAYIAGNTRVRFVVVTQSNDQYLYVDNVQIAYSAAFTGGSTAFSTASASASVVVTAVNDAPTIGTTGSTLAYTENAAATVIDSGLTLSDVDSTNLTGATVTISANYAVGQDVLAFTDQLGITGSWTAGTGVLTLSGTTTVANYQAALRSITYVNTSDNPSTTTRTVSFVVNDGSTDSNTGTRDVGVAAVNDAPVIGSNGGGATAAIGVAENLTAVTTVTSTDVDGGTAVYSIGGGADAAKFTIDPNTGVLSFNSASNFESPTDSGGNNVYDVTVQVSDGNGGVDMQAIAVTVTNVNEAPVIASDGGGGNAGINVAENQTFATTVTSSDVDGGTPVYSIVGGADQALFSIDSSTGALTFNAPPNFEAPTDASGNNVYDVTVQVSDGNGGADTQAIAVTVTNVNEAPVITSNGAGATAAVNVTEKQTAVTTVTATDVDAAATQSFAIVGGADAVRFTIDAATGVLSFVAAPDFELPADADADNVYELTVRASDGALAASQAIRVTVVNLNEAPILLLPRAAAVDEGAAAGTPVAQLTAVDPDAGDLASFSLVTDAAGRFTIDPASGRLWVAPGALLDFESQSVFDLRVRITDAGGLSSEQTLRVTLRDVPEAAAQATPEAGDSSAQVPTLPTVLLSTGDSNSFASSATASAQPELVRRAPSPTGRSARLPSDADGGVDSVLARLRPDATSAADPNGRGANDSGTAQRAHPRQRDAAFGLFASLLFDGAGPAGAAAGDAWAETPAVNDTDMALRSSPAAHRLLPVEADTTGAVRDAGGHSTPATLSEIVQDPVRVSSVAFSAGFIWWLTRSGGLLMTMLMGIPAWRHIDLLPVLARPIDDEDDDEDTHSGQPGNPRGDPRGAEAIDSELDPAGAADLAVDGLFDRSAAGAQLPTLP